MTGKFPGHGMEVSCMLSIGCLIGVRSKAELRPLSSLDAFLDHDQKGSEEKHGDQTHCAH